MSAIALLEGSLRRSHRLRLVVARDEADEARVWLLSVFGGAQLVIVCRAERHEDLLFQLRRRLTSLAECADIVSYFLLFCSVSD